MAGGNGTDPAYVTLTVEVNASANASGGGGGGGEEGGGGFAVMLAVYEQNAPAVLAIDRYVTPLFYLMGLPCNPLCAYIWLGRSTRRSNSSAIYLGALSLSHTVFLALHIFNELNYAWGVPTFAGPVACELFYTVFMWPQYLAPLLVLGFTVERYIAVCYPFAKERYCTVRRAVAVVLGLLLLCLLLSSMQAYLWTYDPHLRVCNHRPSLRFSVFVRTWTWVTELVLFAVAPLAALTFNILVIREIRAITRRGPAMGGAGEGGGGGGNQASTMTLLCVSFYLICTWLPATLVYSMEQEFPIGLAMPPLDEADAAMWRRHFNYLTVRKAVEEVTLSNSACYFFIYCLTGKHFRRRVAAMLLPASCRGRGCCGGSGPRHSNGSLNGRAAASSTYIAVPGQDSSNNTHVTSV